MSNKHFLFLMLCYLSEEYYVLNKKKSSNKKSFLCQLIINIHFLLSVNQHLSSPGVTLSFKRCSLRGKFSKLMQLFGLIVMKQQAWPPARLPASFLICISISSSAIPTLARLAHSPLRVHASFSLLICLLMTRIGL